MSYFSYQWHFQGWLLVTDSGMGFHYALEPVQVGMFYIYNGNKNNSCKLFGLWLSLSLVCSLEETTLELRHFSNKSISEETRNCCSLNALLWVSDLHWDINVPATFKTAAVLQGTPQPKLTTQGVRLGTDAVRRLGKAKNPGTAWGNKSSQNGEASARSQRPLRPPLCLAALFSPHKRAKWVWCTWSHVSIKTNKSGFLGASPAQGKWVLAGW